VTGEEQEVAGLHFQGEPHEDGGVQAQSNCHLSTDDLRRLPGDVSQSSERNTPVGHWTPEMSAHQILSKFFRF